MPIEEAFNFALDKTSTGSSYRRVSQQAHKLSEGRKEIEEGDNAQALSSGLRLTRALGKLLLPNVAFSEDGGTGLAAEIEEKTDGFNPKEYYAFASPSGIEESGSARLRTWSRQKEPWKTSDVELKDPSGFWRAKN